jgi:hypothetical protein
LHDEKKSKNKKASPSGTPPRAKYNENAHLISKASKTIQGFNKGKSRTHKLTKAQTTFDE